MKSILLKLIQIYFAITSKLFPSLAVISAEKLFTMPFFSTRRDVEKELIDKAEKFHIPSDKSGHLVAYRWGKRNDPIILFVHGWTSTGTCFLSFIDPLVAKGYQVISYDSIAHGDTPGRSVSVTEWADTVLAALDHIGHVHCIVGHSLGGGAIVVASNRGLDTDKLVLISSMSDILEVTEQFSEVLRIPENIMERMRQYAWKKYHNSASKYGDDWHDIFFSSFKVPTLIMHDKDDKEVSPNNSKRILNIWPWAIYMETEHLGHRRMLLNYNVITTILDFISREECTSSYSFESHLQKEKDHAEYAGSHHNQ